MSNSSSDRRHPSRVLIVETDETRAKEFYRMLKGVQRLEVQWVGGKLAAFERLKAWQPQLILIGDELNGHCGLELTIWMRKYSYVPIMVVTEDDSFDYYLQILNSGADGCVYHPIPAPLLSAQILALLRRAYRYSTIVEKKLPEENTQKAPNGSFRSTTNTPPLPTEKGAASVVSAAVTQQPAWPSCGVCNYMGPPEKFQAVTANGDTLMRCPACSSSHQLRFTLG